MTIFIMRMLSVLPLVAVIVTTGAAPAKVEDRSGSAEEFDLVAFWSLEAPHMQRGGSG